MTNESHGEPAPMEADHRRQIAELKQHVAEMTALALGMVADGTRALLSSDKELSYSVVSRDAPLDRFDLNIETESVRLVAIIQPEGPDLRTIEAVLKIANCVDRVGRLGYDLARNVVPAPEATDAPVRELIREMDEKARAMVTESMEAFLTGDAPRAKAVFALDDAVDALYHDAQTRIILLLRQGGKSADRLAYELLGIRHLERVADNACKISEMAVYAITGARRSEYFPSRGSRRGREPPPAGRSS